jgi:hypothetical protein
MACIKISLHDGSVFSGSYWLERVNWTGQRPEIIAHFTPLPAQCGVGDAVAAAQWLVANRIDMDLVTVEGPNGFTYSARKPVCA